MFSYLTKAFINVITFYQVNHSLIKFNKHIISWLPAANEVWSKVIFSQACVIPPVHGEGGGDWVPSMHHRSHDHGVCIQGGSASRGSPSGGLHLEGSASRRVCIQGFCIREGGLHPEGSASRRVCIQGVLHPGVSASIPHQILQDTVNERGVHILLECILVQIVNVHLEYNFKGTLEKIELTELLYFNSWGIQTLHIVLYLLL